MPACTIASSLRTRYAGRSKAELTAIAKRVEGFIFGYSIDGLFIMLVICLILANGSFLTRGYNYVAGRTETGFYMPAFGGSCS